MKPRDKAEELVRKMCLNDCTIKNIDKAKQFALIAIDEMMEVYASACVAMGISKEDAEKQQSKYLQEVKQEIEKL